MSISRFFSVDHRGDVAILTPNVRQTDLREINDFQNELLDFVDHYKPAKLVVDLSVVLRTSSWFLGVLLRLERRVSAHQGVMRLCGMNPVVREVFHITALDRKKFQIVGTVDEAVSDIEKAATARVQQPRSA
jgi:anti-anti-sigma factor